MSDPDYPTNWDVHQKPLCSKCGQEVPHQHSVHNETEYFIATQYDTDGTDGWHQGGCPE